MLFMNFWGFLLLLLLLAAAFLGLFIIVKREIHVLKIMVKTNSMNDRLMCDRTEMYLTKLMPKQQQQQQQKQK